MTIRILFHAPWPVTIVQLREFAVIVRGIYPTKTFNYTDEQWISEYRYWANVLIEGKQRPSSHQNMLTILWQFNPNEIRWIMRRSHRWVL